MDGNALAGFFLFWIAVALLGACGVFVGYALRTTAWGVPLTLVGVVIMLAAKAIAIGTWISIFGF